jgi:hypothetical protein
MVNPFGEFPGLGAVAGYAQKQRFKFRAHDRIICQESFHIPLAKKGAKGIGAQGENRKDKSQDGGV